MPATVEGVSAGRVVACFETQCVVRPSLLSKCPGGAAVSVEEGVCCEDAKKSQACYLRVEGLPEPGPHTVLLEKLLRASLAWPPESFIKPAMQAVKGARVCRLTPLGLSCD